MSNISERDEWQVETDGKVLQRKCGEKVGYLKY